MSTAARIDQHGYPTSPDVIRVTFADGSSMVYDYGLQNRESVDYTGAGVATKPINWQRGSAEWRKLLKQRIAATNPKPARTRTAKPAPVRIHVKEQPIMTKPVALPSIATQLAEQMRAAGLTVAYADDAAVVLTFAHKPKLAVKEQLKAAGFRWTATLTWSYGPLDRLPAAYVSTERRVA
jgi:hypothetical protein